MERLNNIVFGILCGLLAPVAFIWLYLYNFYPTDITFFDSIKELWGTALLGKLLLLSVMPDLILTFIFYKQDWFKVGAGIILGIIPYLTASIFMFN